MATRYLVRNDSEKGTWKGLRHVSSSISTKASAAHLRLLELPETDSFDVAGVSVAALSFREAIQTLIAAPRQGRRLRVHFGAVHTFVEASKSEELRASLDEADFVMPDGMPLVMLGRIAGKKIERVCGPDTMLEVLDRSRIRNYSHYFYGGTPDSLAALALQMTERYPGLQIAGLHAPPFRSLSAEEIAEVADRINAAEPDFVWVGLGSPKQDEWLATFRPLLDASVLLAVGAAFDFHAGLRKRAPLWAQRSGLEWAFRLAAEPRRLAMRYAVMAGFMARILVSQAFRPREVNAHDEW